MSTTKARNTFSFQSIKVDNKTIIRLAGSDTTAISLRAILYYLIQNPKSYKRLQAEIDQADRAGKLSKYMIYGESLELDYL
jgi:cytochrome P450